MPRSGSNAGKVRGLSAIAIVASDGNAACGFNGKESTVVLTVAS